MTSPALPGEVPGACLSCGGTSYPVQHDRCTLCQAVHGPASAPEPIAPIVAQVMADLERRRASA